MQKRLAYVMFVVSVVGVMMAVEAWPPAALGQMRQPGAVYDV